MADSKGSAVKDQAVPTLGMIGGGASLRLLHVESVANARWTCIAGSMGGGCK